jgi:hypothetical protein
MKFPALPRFALALLLLTAPAFGGEFDWMVRQFARESGTDPLHIPFFGVARFLVSTTEIAGTSDIHLAVFPDMRISRERYAALTGTIVGPSWKPMLRVRSGNGESTDIYAVPVGKQLEILLCSYSGNEATFMQAKLKPEKLISFVDEHRHH